MRRRFLKQLMMSFAAVALLGAQAEIAEPETEELRLAREMMDGLKNDWSVEIDGVKINVTMALAC